MHVDFYMFINGYFTITDHLRSTFKMFQFQLNSIALSFPSYQSEIQRGPHYQVKDLSKFFEVLLHMNCKIYSLAERNRKGRDEFHKVCPWMSASNMQ